MFICHITVQYQVASYIMQDFVAEVVQLFFEDSVVKIERMCEIASSSGSAPDFNELDQLVRGSMVAPVMRGSGGRMYPSCNCDGPGSLLIMVPGAPVQRQLR